MSTTQNVNELVPSQRCLDELREREKFEAEAYPDPGSVDGNPWTIGYGTTVYPDGTKVKDGDTCTPEEALEWFLYHVDVHVTDEINRRVLVELNQNQFDALVSFVYNIGAGKAGLGGSTLLRLLNAGDYDGAAAQFIRWNKNDGKVMRGLTTRRQTETDLFLS